jgi:hypothetical protein
MTYSVRVKAMPSLPVRGGSGQARRGPGDAVSSDRIRVAVSKLSASTREDQIALLYRTAGLSALRFGLPDLESRGGALTFWFDAARFLARIDRASDSRAPDSTMSATQRGDG